MYGSYALDNVSWYWLNPTGVSLQVPWDALVEHWCLWNVFILGGMAIARAYPKMSSKVVTYFYIAIGYFGIFLSIAVVIVFIVVSAVYCPQAYDFEFSNGYLWGCALFQPISTWTCCKIVAHFMKLDRRDSNTVAMTGVFIDVQYAFSVYAYEYYTTGIRSTMEIYPVILLCSQIFWCIVLEFYAQYDLSKSPDKAKFRRRNTFINMW